jgi:AraC-like DNA-binding protein
MSTFQEYVSVIGCFQGCLLFGLLVADQRMNTSSRILGVICFLIALVFLMPFLLANSGNAAIARTLGLVFFFPVALGPLGYLYCRTAILETPLVRRDLLHLLPWVFCYVLTADVLLADPKEMVDWMAGAEPRNGRLQISEYVPVAVAYAYAAWTGLIIWRYRRQAKDNLANFNPSVFNWLLTLQALSFIVWTLKTLPGPSAAPRVFTDTANLFLIALIYAIAIMQWRNPQFFSIPSLAEERAKAMPEKRGKDISSKDGELDPAIRAELFETLKKQIETSKLYLDNRLTLTRLSVATGLSKHHLSEVLNLHAGKNFYEFINGYRVEFVRERLEENTQQTVLDISLEAGFSSKSTFNAIFKKFTGQTPTEYRKALASKRR